MNRLDESIEPYCDALHTHLKSHASLGGKQVQIGIAPTLIYLQRTVEYLRALKSPLWVIAQNGSQETEGAFTGESSMKQIKDIGADAVLIGHSERRNIYGETQQDVIKKIECAQAAGLKSILCVGERESSLSLSDREVFLKSQLEGLESFDWTSIVIAYEPVWAIGGTQAASTEHIETSSAMLTKGLKEILRRPVAVPIIYGGSVSKDNFPSIVRLPNIAGGLIGSASLDSSSMISLLDLLSEDKINPSH